MGTFSDSLSKLVESVPTTAVKAKACLQIRSFGDLDPHPWFFEPASVIDGTYKRKRLVSLDPILLRAWCRHIAFSTRVRLIQIEDSIPTLLLENLQLPAFVLIRSHVEAAGLSALCLNTLSDCMSTGDVSPLMELIPRTLFGTSLRRQSQKDEVTSALLSFEEGDPPKVAELLKGLEEFARSTGGDGSYFPRTYSLLCESAHPNLRGTRDFTEVRDVDDRGWEIKYGNANANPTQAAEVILDVLVNSMKVGYSSWMMLLRADFHISDNQVVYESPSPEDLEEIWKNIVHCDSTSGS